MSTTLHIWDGKHATARERRGFLARQRYLRKKYRPRPKTFASTKAARSFTDQEIAADYEASAAAFANDAWQAFRDAIARVDSEAGKE